VNEGERKATTRKRERRVLRLGRVEVEESEVREGGQ
jgi:hypothetical protein